MKFFIDAANVDEIREASSMGMADGVTTNPSLIAKEGRDFEGVIKEICEIVASVRHPLHVLESAMMGADIATVPFSVLSKFAAHPLTDKGIKAFLDDWEKAKQ